MKFTAIIGVGATLLGAAFASSAETEKIDAGSAALRGKGSREMQSTGDCTHFFADQDAASELYRVVCGDDI